MSTFVQFLGLTFLHAGAIALICAAVAAFTSGSGLVFLLACVGGGIFLTLAATL
jgi:hypothetical protein